MDLTPSEREDKYSDQSKQEISVSSNMFDESYVYKIIRFGHVRLRLFILQFFYVKYVIISKLNIN